MTSEHTKEPTREFFKQHDHFGIGEEDLVLFEQEMLPCVSFEGKIILDQKNKISRAPGKSYNYDVSISNQNYKIIGMMSRYKCFK